MSLTNGNGTKLVGKDARLYKSGFGAEILGDGLTALPEGIYMVVSVAAVSGFPPTASGGIAIAAGDVLNVASGVTITPETDDDVVTLSSTPLCDTTSWTMEFSKPEIDTTTQCDPVKTYRAGKSDMAGTAEGIFTMGITDDPDTGSLIQFIDIAQQDAGTSFDRFETADSVGMGIFYTNYDTSIGDQMYIVAPYQLYVNTAGGGLDDAQSFSGSFRFANLSYTVLGGTNAGDTIAVKPTYYRLGS